MVSVVRNEMRRGIICPREGFVRDQEDDEDNDDDREEEKVSISAWKARCTWTLSDAVIFHHSRTRARVKKDHGRQKNIILGSCTLPSVLCIFVYHSFFVEGQPLDCDNVNMLGHVPRGGFLPKTICRKTILK
jgi:hypothetical protein